MIKEAFLGNNPSHFIKVDPLVKAYIVSECFLWSSWNFIIPIFAVFATTQIKGGTIQAAASSYSVYLMIRVVFELFSGKLVSGKSENQKILVIIAGISCLSLAYLGFAFSSSFVHLFLSFAIAGIGFGLAAPVKSSLFSMHLDKDKEATEWSFADASMFISMALATALGGFIAGFYGFKILFFLASIVNVFALLPYLLYVKRGRALK
jgi:MFS family permease